MTGQFLHYLFIMLLEPSHGTSGLFFSPEANFLTFSLPHLYFFLTLSLTYCLLRAYNHIYISYVSEAGVSPCLEVTVQITCVAAQF